MFINRKIPNVKSSTVVAKADFSGKSNTNAFTEEYSLNANTQNGVLSALREFTQFGDRTDVYAAYQTPLGVVYCTDSGIYLVKGSSKWKKSSSVFAKPYFLYCYNQKVVSVSQEDKGCYQFDANSQCFSPAGYATLAMCKERVFGAKKNTLYFTQSESVLTWNQYVQLPQNVCAVVAQGESLLAVGDNIYKIDISDDTTDIKVTCVCSGVGEVYPSTVRVLHNKLIFLTKSGLYCFSQNKLQRICKDLQFADDPKAVAAVGENRYWLAFAEKGKSRVLISTDTQDCLRYGIAATHISDGALLAVCDGKVYQLGSGYSQLFWKSKFCDFGSYEQKHLRTLYIETKNSVDVHLVTEKERRFYHITSGSHKIRLCGAFEKLSVEIFADGETEISNLEVEARTYGREVNRGN